VDWRDAPDAASATENTTFVRQAAFLLRNGKIVDLDGASPITYNYLINDNLFVVIWHRNHLPVMSANPLVESGGIYSYDFTTAMGMAYLNGQKSLNGSVYGMYAGDADGNGEIESIDKNGFWAIQAGNKGYKSADFNMNSQVDNLDKNDFWTENNGISSQIPD
jgi:hypothetical protein